MKHSEPEIIKILGSDVEKRVLKSGNTSLKFLTPRIFKNSNAIGTVPGSSSKLFLNMFVQTVSQSIVEDHKVLRCLNYKMTNKYFGITMILKTKELNEIEYFVKKLQTI